MKVIRYYYRRPGYYAAECCADEMAKPTPGANATPDDDTSFKQYEILVDLYKHWLELILKYNGAYYVITGVMVSYSLANQTNRPLRFSLMLPIAMGIGLTIYALKCVSLMTKVEKAFVRLEGALDLVITPEVIFIKSLLRLSAFFFCIVVLGLAVWVLIPFFSS